MILDCGDSSCNYAPLPLTGMRTNGGCRCMDKSEFKIHASSTNSGWVYTNQAIRYNIAVIKERNKEIERLQKELEQCRTSHN